MNIEMKNNKIAKRKLMLCDVIFFYLFKRIRKYFKNLRFFAQLNWKKWIKIYYLFFILFLFPCIHAFHTWSEFYIRRVWGFRMTTEENAIFFSFYRKKHYFYCIVTWRERIKIASFERNIERRWDLNVEPCWKVVKKAACISEIPSTVNVSQWSLSQAEGFRWEITEILYNFSWMWQ